MLQMISLVQSMEGGEKRDKNKYIYPKMIFETLRYN